MKIILLSLLFISTIARAQNSTDNWFPFNPTDYYKPGSLNMSDWLDKPAGKHGFLQITGKDFAFEDGTPVKFWGVNIAGDSPFSSAEKSSGVDSLYGEVWNKRSSFS